MKRNNSNAVASERIEILERNLLCELGIDNDWAEKQARVALRIALHSRVSIPYSLRQLFCRSCKQFIIPGKTSRVRTGRSRTKSVRITCLKCMHVYRKMISPCRPR
ncbi:MAG: RNase P subunit [Nitrososphaeraceae archaeon]